MNVRMQSNDGDIIIRSKIKGEGGMEKYLMWVRKWKLAEILSMTGSRTYEYCSAALFFLQFVKW